MTCEASRGLASLVTGATIGRHSARLNELLTGQAGRDGRRDQYSLRPGSRLARYTDIETQGPDVSLSAHWSSASKCPIRDQRPGWEKIIKTMSVQSQECPLTETICACCTLLAGDTGCPLGSGLVHMKYLAVVTGARCDFIGHVPSLASLAGSIFRLSFVIWSHAGIVSILSLSLSSSQTRVFEACVFMFRLTS